MGHSPVFAPFMNINTKGAAFGTTAGNQYIERYANWPTGHAEAPTLTRYQVGRTDTDQLLINSAAALRFGDGNKGASTYAGDLLLSLNSGEWDSYDTNFGEVSLMNALNQLSASGAGDVMGPASSTDDEIVRFSGATGKIIKDAGAVLLSATGAFSRDSGNMSFTTTTSGNIVLTAAGLLDMNSQVDHDVTFPDTLAGIARAYDALYTIDNSGNSVASIRAIDYQINKIDINNLTTVIGINAQVSSSAAGGILSNIFAGNYNISNTGAGEITTGTGVNLIAANTGGGTYTNFTGMSFDRSDATNTVAMNFDADFVSNSRAVTISEGGIANSRFFPLSRSDDGITFDSTPLVLATTTSGDIQLNPADLLTSVVSLDADTEFGWTMTATGAGDFGGIGALNLKAVSGGMLTAGDFLFGTKTEMSGSASDVASTILIGNAVINANAVASVGNLVGYLVDYNGIAGSVPTQTGTLDGFSALITSSVGASVIRGLQVTLTSNTVPATTMLGLQVEVNPDIAGITSVRGVSVENGGSETADEACRVGGQWVKGLDLSTGTFTTDIDLGTGIINHTSGDITLQTTTSGDVNLSPTSNIVNVGDGTAGAIIQSSGNNNLDLRTGNASTPSIQIVHGGGSPIIVSLPSSGFFTVNGRFVTQLTSATTGSDQDLGAFRHTLSLSGSSIRQYTGLDTEVLHTSGNNLTNATFGMLGHQVVVRKSSTGTDTSIGGMFIAVENTNVGGTVTDGLGIGIAPSNSGGGVFTTFTGMRFVDDAGNMPTNNFAFDFEGTTWVSNARAVTVADDGIQRFMPLSTTDTGLVFDSTDVTVGTTTSGNVILDPITEVDIRGGQKVARVAAGDADHTALVSEYLIAYDVTITATRTVSLPAAATAGAGKMFRIKDETGSFSGPTNCIVDPNGAETIDGAATFTMNGSFESITIYTDGSNWFIL